MIAWVSGSTLAPCPESGELDRRKLARILRVLQELLGGVHVERKALRLFAETGHRGREDAGGLVRFILEDDVDELIFVDRLRERLTNLRIVKRRLLCIEADVSGRKGRLLVELLVQGVVLIAYAFDVVNSDPGEIELIVLVLG